MCKVGFFILIIKYIFNYLKLFFQIILIADFISASFNIYSPKLCICFLILKNLCVSDAATPLSANMAIIFGMAIRPLNILADVHTALTVMYGPINTAAI